MAWLVVVTRCFYLLEQPWDWVRYLALLCERIEMVVKLEGGYSSLYMRNTG